MWEYVKLTQFEKIQSIENKTSSKNPVSNVEYSISVKLYYQPQ